MTSGIRRYSAAEPREAVPAADQAALALPERPRRSNQRVGLATIARKATAGATSPMQEASYAPAAYLRKHVTTARQPPSGTAIAASSSSSL